MLKKDHLFLIIFGVPLSIALLLVYFNFFLDALNKPKQLTYEEWLAKDQADGRYMFTILPNSKNGGLTIGYNGCIYYHREFIGCDKAIAKSIYETFGEYYFPKK